MNKKNCRGRNDISSFVIFDVIFVSPNSSLSIVSFYTIRLEYTVIYIAT